MKKLIGILSLAMLPSIAWCRNIPLPTGGPHIPLPKEGNPQGISAVFAYSPKAGQLVRELAQHLLQERTTDTFTKRDRELVATYVSYLNECYFCTNSHGSISANSPDGDYTTVHAVLNDYKTAPIRESTKHLLHIAGKVQQGGKTVTDEDVQNALAAGATQSDVNDAMWIASYFCLANRLVNSFNPPTPDSNSPWYDDRAKIIAKNGYRTVAGQPTTTIKTDSFPKS